MSDLISRQENRSAIRIIMDFPTAVVVERKKGEWIKNSDTAFYWKCSECGAYLFWRKEEYLLREEDEANFCPNCDADMRKEVER